MGAFARTQAAQALPGELSLIREARSYTLYARRVVWYVNFRAGGRQYRISLGVADHEHARVIVEQHRGTAGAPQLYSDKHLYRMIERARHRNRRKGIPIGIGIADLRALVDAGGGLCAVSGHPLEESGPFRPSLDRINPALGYVAGNVRIVCLIANTAMLHYGETAFGELAIAYCRRIGALPDPSAQPSTRPFYQWRHARSRARDGRTAR